LTQERSGVAGGGKHGRNRPDPATAPRPTPAGRWSTFEDHLALDDFAMWIGGTASGGSGET